MASDRVTVSEGKLAGSISYLPSGKPYASFRGIPYAAPPIGKLRFRAPQPPIKWKGTRDATKHGSCCPQVSFIIRDIKMGVEDCLFLNVYTPNTKTPTCPVMVWLHGGGYISGSGDSDIFNPELLVDEGVVVVTLNYRLEALGFLCLDIEECPGNAGMKDQVAALRWVKKNIPVFGGDPNNVTVFGESAGGASASYHLISPMSKGLANKIIAQSGSFLNDRAQFHNAKQRTLQLAAAFGEDTKDPKKILLFLQSLPVMQLVNCATLIITQEEISKGFGLVFAPTVEKEFNGQEAFLSKCPRELLDTDKFYSIPVLMGYNNKEGLFLLNHTLNNLNVINYDLNIKIPDFVYKKVNSDELKAITKKIKTFYFKDKLVNATMENEIVDMDTDVAFTVGIVDLARRLGRISHSPVFLYKFSVSTDLNMTKNIMGLGHYDGACHGDELFYIWKNNFGNQEDSKTVKQMVKMWTNFAKYGNPIPKTDDLFPVLWKPVTKSTLNYLEIGPELTPGENPDKERQDLWSEIIDITFKKNPVKCNL